MNLQRMVLFIAILVPVAVLTIVYRSPYRSATQRRTKPKLSQGCKTYHLSSDQCARPSGGYSGWKIGLVTKLTPTINRNCSKLFAGDKTETLRIKEANGKWRNSLSDKRVAKLTQNCSWLQDIFMNNLYNSKLELSFPLAYTFVIHNRAQQVLRLLKLLYRPQNVYCIHYDSKSSKVFKTIFDHVASCFDNVIIASRVVSVEWGQRSIMTAQMNCLHDLLTFRECVQWQYVINLCGKELPLLTGREMVAKLMALNGSSTLKPTLQPRDSSSWSRLSQALRNRNTTTIPHNLTLYKSSSYNAFSYLFAEYLTSDPRAISLRSFFSDASHPEEHYYATVYMQPGVPGGFNPSLSRDRYFRVALATWCFHKSCKRLCHGRWYHAVCVSGAGDLPNIRSTAAENGNMFHNKYSIEVDHTVMDCMEEVIIQRNKLEYQQECP